MSSATPDDESSSGEDEGSSSDDAPVDEPSAELLRCNDLIGCIDTSCNEKRLEWQACKDDHTCSIDEAISLWDSYEGCAYECGAEADFECSAPEPLCKSVIDDAWLYASDCVDDNRAACELATVECVDVW